MSKNPGKVGFMQPAHMKTGHSTGKNPSKLGFTQPGHGKGGTSSKKSPGKLGYTQPNHGKTGSSTAKNPAKVGFVQKVHGTPVKMPAASGAGPVGAKMGKAKAPPAVGPKMKSLDDVMAYRKKTYGV